MMKLQKWAMYALMLCLSVFTQIPEAEAKRLGGGQSSGMQRDITPPPRQPGQNQAQSPTPAAGTPAAPQRSRSWLGPVAGLAAGLGLAALASHLGFGEGLASFMLILLLVGAAFMAYKLLTRSRRGPAAPLQYAGATQGLGHGASGAALQPAHGSGVPASLPASPVSQAHWPADFDASGFARQAKLNFIRLQAANDAGDLEDLRSFTTPELFAEIRLQLAERKGTAQQTDVVEVAAEVLDVQQDGGRYIVSVQFYGLLRETAGGPTEPFDETWHLVKPIEGQGGWLVAGIQQNA